MISGVRYYGFLQAQHFANVALEHMSPGVSSNHIKPTVYQDTFRTETRHKRTGFEHLSQLDQRYREFFSQSVKDEITVWPAPLPDFGGTPYSDRVQQYRQELTDKARTYTGQINLLYYSGGADSEAMVCAFRDAGVDFMVIVFVFVSDRNQVDDAHAVDQEHQQFDDSEFLSQILPFLMENEVIINLYELSYARKFTKHHQIPVSYRAINVPDLWQSDQYQEKFQSEGISSPQILTQRTLMDLVEHEIDSLGLSNLDKYTILRYGI